MTQKEKLDRLLSDHEDQWVTLTQIHELGIYVHSRRIEEVRALYRPLGFIIENKTERGDDGVTRSWYRKVRDPWRARLRKLTEQSHAPQPESSFELVP
jgi:hypothetical protein